MRNVRTCVSSSGEYISAALVASVSRRRGFMKVELLGAEGDEGNVGTVGALYTGIVLGPGVADRS